MAVWETNPALAEPPGPSKPAGSMLRPGDLATVQARLYSSVGADAYGTPRRAAAGGTGSCRSWPLQHPRGTPGGPGVPRRAGGEARAEPLKHEQPPRLPSRVWAGHRDSRGAPDPL